MSLKSAQKAVRGIKGRDPPTGTTFLKSWQAFKEEVSKIWQNARTYNEDGSDISELAGELEVDNSLRGSAQITDLMIGVLLQASGRG